MTGPRGVVPLGLALLAAVAGTSSAAAEIGPAPLGGPDIDVVMERVVESSGAVDWLDIAFGGFQIAGGDVSLTASIAIPSFPCEPRSDGASRIRLDDSAILPSAFVRDATGRMVGGAGVVVGCDYEEGSAVQRFFPLLIAAGRSIQVVTQPVASGDRMRVSYTVDELAGTATSTLENGTQGWQVTTEPYPPSPVVVSEIGDVKIRYDLGPIRNFIALPEITPHTVSRITVDGAAPTRQSTHKIVMVTPLGAIPEIRPSIQDHKFTLTKVL